MAPRFAYLSLPRKPQTQISSRGFRRFPQIFRIHELHEFREFTGRRASSLALEILPRKNSSLSEKCRKALFKTERVY